MIAAAVAVALLIFAVLMSSDDGSKASGGTDAGNDAAVAEMATSGQAAGAAAMKRCQSTWNAQVEWDYYRQRFERNRGMRIDFLLGSPALTTRVSGAFVDRDD